MKFVRLFERFEEDDFDFIHDLFVGISDRWHISEVNYSIINNIHRLSTFPHNMYSISKYKGIYKYDEDQISNLEIKIVMEVEPISVQYRSLIGIDSRDDNMYYKESKKLIGKEFTDSIDNFVKRVEKYINGINKIRNEDDGFKEKTNRFLGKTTSELSEKEMDEFVEIIYNHKIKRTSFKSNVTYSYKYHSINFGRSTPFAVVECYIKFQNIDS